MLLVFETIRKAIEYLFYFLGFSGRLSSPFPSISIISALFFLFCNKVSEIVFVRTSAFVFVTDLIGSAAVGVAILCVGDISISSTLQE